MKSRIFTSTSISLLLLIISAGLVSPANINKVSSSSSQSSSKDDQSSSLPLAQASTTSQTILNADDHNNNNNNNGGILDQKASASSLSSTNAQAPRLLSLEQQQDLLEQLAQLQRQTQQLLAAQQSLAAVAAAAAANNGAGGGLQSSPQSSFNQQQPSQSFRQQQPQSQSQPQHLMTSSIRNTVGQQQPPQSQPQNQVIQNQPSNQPDNNQSGNNGGNLPQSPQINWGKCPELEPSEQEKLAKANVITKCLETTPLPANITRESVEQHREQIAACALRSEGWFTPSGAYDFGKAEKEIKNKRLQSDLESQVLNYHSQCKVESEEKYPSTNSSIISQIQLYQACMDYFISDVCGIEVNDSDSPQF